MIGKTLNGRFLLDKELGRGGMGAVYRATDQVLQRAVAIKVLKDLGGEEVGRKLRLEAQILARLMHESIVRLYDFSEDEGTFYFIMEEVDGSSFQRRWKQVELAERCRVVAEVADALDYAHHQGVIHRDVKPANVLLTSLDRAKLSDFGLSMLAESTQETGVVKGTPHYMSPEQARGKKLDHRTDLYALGVILYECVTGSPPFSGSLMSIMSQHVNAEAERPRQRTPDVSVELDRLIVELMAKAPEARPASGREVAGRLRELIAAGRVLASGDTSQTVAKVPTAADPKSVGALSPGTLIGPPTPGSGSDVSFAPPTGASASIAPKPAPPAAAARALIAAVEAEPVALSAEQRFYIGHYLAYLLGGSRRRGFLRRRPLDGLNADRARLLLAMTYLIVEGSGEPQVARAAAMMEAKPDVRPGLSPVVLAKYLAGRDTPGKRKRFRQARQLLQQASPYAEAHLTDERGVLNPGLMPQQLSDLRRLAPEESHVDGGLAERWNRVTEAWRGKPEFRESVLRYATKAAWNDPASASMWPEVVYPLIERARWQRQLRSAGEVAWDRVAGGLGLPDAGNRMEKAFKAAVPERVVEQLEVSLRAFVDDPDLGEDDPEAGSDQEAQAARIAASAVNPRSFEDIGPDDAPTRTLVRLRPPEPTRLSMGELRELWQAGLAALRKPGPADGRKVIPVGPYRLSVVASIRSRSAGQVVIQGMPNKQIELLVPSFTGGGNNGRPVVAAWTYANNSAVITYTDHMGTQKYICWDASINQQQNFDDGGALNHALFGMGLEVPDQVDRVLLKSYRPRVSG